MSFTEDLHDGDDMASLFGDDEPSPLANVDMAPSPFMEVDAHAPAAAPYMAFQLALPTMRTELVDRTLPSSSIDAGVLTPHSSSTGFSGLALPGDDYQTDQLGFLHSPADFTSVAQVSTQNLGYNAQAMLEDDDAELEAMLEEEIALDTYIDKPTEAPLPTGDQGLGQTVTLHDIGYSHADAVTLRDTQLPRRADVDNRFHEVLPYILCRADTTRAELYELLELSVAQGKEIDNVVRPYLKSLAEPIQINLTGEARKKLLMGAAIELLMRKEYGIVWFGNGSLSASTRKFFWPDDSTVLVVRFVRYLYNISRSLAVSNKKRETKLASSAERLWLSSPPRMDGAYMGHYNTPASTPPPGLRVVEAQAAARSTIYILPEYASPYFYNTSSTPDPVSPQASDVEPGETTGNADQSAAAPRPAFSELAQLALLKKQGKKRIPANAPLKYRIRLIDHDDSTELGPSVDYAHSDDKIVRGAFSSFTAPFKQEGKEVSVQVSTPFGKRVVTNQEEWDQAVFAVWKAKADGLVDVRIYM